MKKVKVEFTIEEAEELLGIACNGYGDGDYYLNNNGSDSGEAAYIRADQKIRDAIRKLKEDKKI